MEIDGIVPDALRFDALMTALSDSANPTLGQSLDVVATCEEIVAFSSPSLRAENEIRDQVTQSLLIEFQNATSGKSLGPKLREKLVEPIKQVLLALNRTGDLRRAGGPAADVLHTLTDPEVIAAAWDDLVQVCGKSDKYDKFAGRRDAFIAIARLNRHELNSFSRADMAKGVLKNHAFTIAEAREFLGATVAEMPDPSQEATLTRDERLALCRQIWQQSNGDVDNVVWLNYEFATMSAPKISKGRITFYSVEHLTPALAGRQDAAFMPHEVANRLDTFREWLPPAEHGQVIVRVEVTSPATQAVDIAVRETEALLQLAARVRRIGWKRMPHRVFHVIDNHYSQWTSWRHGAALEPKHWRKSAVAMLLADPSVQPQPSERIRDSLARLGALANDSDDPPQRRVVARVELIERAKLSVSDQHWVDLAKKLRPIWVSDTLVNNLLNTAVWVHENRNARITGVDVATERAKELANSFMVKSGTGLYVNAEKIVGRSRELCDLLPFGWLPREDLVHASKILADNLRVQAESECEALFDLLLQRALRCRNATSHGWPVSERAADSAVPLLMFIADSLIMIQLQAEERSVDPAARLESTINEGRAKYDRILRGDFDRNDENGVP